MGSFSSTCCLSDITIEYGDEVRWLLLTENPYDDSANACYSHDIWFPRTWPIKAKYNDYGSIDDYDSESPALVSVIEGLKKDLVEVGTGDNSIHDVPTKKGMSFEETLEAAWEGRILVIREYERKYAAECAEHLRKHERVPTLQRVIKLLEDENIKIDNSDEGFLVDEIEPGWIRVRTGGFSRSWDTEPLEEILSILQKKYAAMITVGSGGYSNLAEIQIMPLPRSKDINRYTFRLRDSKKPLKVYQAMILGKVWDAIVKQNKDASTYRKDIVGLWKAFLRIDDDRFFWGRGKTIAGDLVVKSVIPFSMGLAEHFSLIVKRHKTNPFSDEQINQFFDDIVGLACVYDLLYSIRYWWRPSFTCGPQYRGYTEQRKWHELLTKVTSNLEHEKDY